MTASPCNRKVAMDGIFKNYSKKPITLHTSNHERNISIFKDRISGKKSHEISAAHGISTSRVEQIYNNVEVQLVKQLIAVTVDHEIYTVMEKTDAIDLARWYGIRPIDSVDRRVSRETFFRKHSVTVFDFIDKWLIK